MSRLVSLVLCAIPRLSQMPYSGLALGVAATTLPNLSATTQVVVPCSPGRYCPGPVSAFILYGSPGRIVLDACFIFIKGHRMPVYLSESNSLMGTFVKAGSP